MADPSPLHFLDDPDEFNALLSIQESMMSLSPDNLESFKQEILQSNWVHNRKSVRQLAASILVAARVRFTSIPSLALFCHFLCGCASPSNSLSKLRHFVLSGIFRAVAYAMSFPNESSMFSLLFQCFQNGIFDITDIIPRLRFLVKEGAFPRSACWAFCYLAPEIQKADTHLYEKLTTALMHGAARAQFPHIFRKFAADLPDLKKQNWRSLKKRRQYFSHKATLLSKIRADDIAALRKAACSPSFNIETRILPTPFTPSAFLQGHPTLIQVAALFGAVECFRFLLANGAQLRTADHNFITLPQFAVAGGSIEIIRLCQQYDLDFFGTIHLAVTFHRHELFEWLTDTLFQDLNVLDLNGNTLLHAACESNNFYVMRFVVEAGLDVNSQTFKAWTPLRIAVRRGFVDAVRYLLTIPTIDINPQSRAGVTPFHLAAKHGDLAIASYLLAHGDVEVDAPSNDGMSALFYAVMNDRLHFTKFLLQVEGVDLNRRGPDRFTPLMTSLLYEYTGITKLFINDPRVDVNVMVGTFYSAVYLAVKNNRIGPLKCLLKRSDLDLRARSEDGLTYLHLAAREKRVEILNLLLHRNEINVNELDGHHATPLHCACGIGDTAGVQALLNVPTIDVNIRNRSSNTALHVAASRGFTEIATLLIARRDTDVNAIGAKGKTPLYKAIEHGRKQIVQLLCKRSDIDISVRSATAEEISPMMLALAIGNLEIVRELLNCSTADVYKVVADARTPIAGPVVVSSPELLALIKSWIEMKKRGMRKNGRKPGMVKKDEKAASGKKKKKEKWMCWCNGMTTPP